MNDLNVIARQNAEAHERDIPNQQALGFFVVAEYHGLHYVGYSLHETEVEANAKACEIGNEVGRRAKVYQPTGQRADNTGSVSATAVSDNTLDLTSLASHSVATGNVQALLAQTEDSIARAVSADITSGGGGDFGGGGATASYDSGSSSDSSSSSVSSTD